MMRYRALGIVAVVVSIVSSAALMGSADETPDTQSLQDRIAKLEQTVARLSKENTELAEQNEELKSPSTPLFSNAPAVVIRTTPPAGDEAVDPSLNEITVKFSKDMRDKSYSLNFHTCRDAFPTTHGSERFREDKRTFVIPVKLEPGKTYAMWLNSFSNDRDYGNFRDKDGRSAVPYLLVFRTRD